MRTHCITCGTVFYRERNETWKKLCLDCWRASKQTKPADDLMRELEQWRARAHLAELKLQLGTGQGAPSAQFDQDELKTLRRLCHPDKHNGSEAATRVSQKINNLIGASNGRA